MGCMSDGAFLNLMPDARKAAAESDEFVVVEDGSITLKDGVTEATLTVNHG